MVKTDIEIAQEATLLPITQIAEQLGLNESDWEPYGRYKGKVNATLLDTYKEAPDGQIILVTSINPTPAGEGKSTVTVGLGQALNRIGKKAVIALREPSLGPNMGLKGGAAGGGYSQVVPMEDINLHFTGDFHAITTAHNTVAAVLDNHIHHGNELDIDPGRIVWRRVLDLNDRALRNIVVGLGGPANGVPREDGFDITVASEIMAILCLAKDLEDLKIRLGKIVVAYNRNREPVTAQDLEVVGALALLLKDAINPNLVQTLENTPAFIHGGPFANIAHGCNSVIATKLAAKLGDYVVTEAGFGADLGAEKFLNIKTRAGDIDPSAVVIVVTVRALKMHGGLALNQLREENLSALEKGLENAEKHIETIQAFGLPFVIAINHFIHDTEKEVALVRSWAHDRGYRAEVARVWEHGGAGGEALAHAVVETIQQGKASFSPLYPLDLDLEEKIGVIATRVYGASGIDFTARAAKQLKDFKEKGWNHLPVCMAKTQYSLSDDPGKLGRPRDFIVQVRELRASVGAGFIVAITGSILTMPGLPMRPAALNMDVTKDGKVTGLF